MKLSSRVTVVLCLTVILHAARILLPTAIPLSAGFSPLGAAALFAGACLPGIGGAILVTLVGMLAGDLIVQSLVYKGFQGFPVYQGWEWVYGSIALMTLAGKLLSGASFGFRKAGVLAVATTASHWLVTNTGIWLSGGCGVTKEPSYTRDLPGYAECLLAAVPYNLRFLAGTLAFGFAAFAALRKFDAAATEARDAKALRN